MGAKEMAKLYGEQERYKLFLVHLAGSAKSGRLMNEVYVKGFFELDGTSMKLLYSDMLVEKIFGKNLSGSKLIVHSPMNNVVKHEVVTL